jgi:hypothetical protein
VKKTSIYLDDELDRALAQRAADEGLTKAELIRRTLAGVVSRPRRVKPQGIGVITSKAPGVSRDVDAALRETGFGEWR